MIEAPERVLATLNADGSRRFLRPRPARGAFWKRRRITAYALMVVFFLIPYLRWGRKPLVLLDIPRRQFTMFGTTFLPTDTLLFMLLFISVAIAILLVTALLGRVWCGWACPQTVYLEFLFRPIEYWLEGGRGGSLALDRAGRVKWRRVAKFAVYTVLALFLAHTFLAYFVGVEQLRHWVLSPPAEHPTAFFVMALTTGLIFFDFAYFREQTCLVVCPYGRLQAVLLDKQSLIVGYDAPRGEPRGKPAGAAALPGAGDCVDCSACVQVCPTGIDIRDGLQMECIHCTQCADACDAIMDRVDKPRGLIRYTSRDRLEGKARRLLRPRVVLYPAALAVVLGLFAYFLGARVDTDITVLRAIGTPWSVQADGGIVNQVRIKVANHSGEARAYQIALAGADGARMIAPENPLRVPAGEERTTSVFVVLAPGEFHDGVRHVSFQVSAGAGFQGDYLWNLLGPDEREEQR
jgi:cytochrome c oxidase accessory protein FixG